MNEQNPALRVRHYQGERLKSRDLQDEQANLSWMRGLHVVALHDTWGISLGFDAQFAVDNAGRRSVFVTPGFAYDYRGREIVLATTQQVFAPQTPGDYQLVMRYDDAIGGDGDENFPCHTGTERPGFVWRRWDAVRLGLEIPLIGITAKGEADTSVRRYAQPMVRPHVGSGTTPPEQSWSNWGTQVDDPTPGMGIQTWVDTSAAGFVQTPYYLAYAYYPASVLNSSPAFAQIAARSSLMLLSMSQRLPWGFDARFTIARGQTGVPNAGFDWAEFPRPQISWIGVEPVVGCAPSISWLALETQFRLRFMR